MNSKTIQKMQCFRDKVCSIVTASMNRAFDEKISREHFVVLIDEITMDGIWGTHPYNPELMSFFNMEHVISIHQEIELDPSNPDHARMIQEYEEESGNELKPDIKPFNQQGTPVDWNNGRTQEETPPEEPEGVTFIDIENLEALAESTKRASELS